MIGTTHDQRTIMAKAKREEADAIERGEYKEPRA
jgi:hypothetical protein